MENNDKSTFVGSVGGMPLHWTMIECCCCQSKPGICISLWCHNGTSHIWSPKLWCCYDRLGIWSLKVQICRSTYVISPYNSGLDAPIWTCRGSFTFLMFSALIWDQEVHDFVHPTLRKSHLKRANWTNKMMIFRKTKLLTLTHCKS